MSQEEKETLEYTEIETKYRVSESALNDWKGICRNLAETDAENYKEFIQVDSDDIYYVKANKRLKSGFDFMRYRYADAKKNTYAELTTKKKLNKNNNIMRDEWNVRVDNNSAATIEGMLVGGLGFQKAFKITKYVYIYKFKHVILPFYTVIDEAGKRDTFCEIEIDEDMLAKGKISEEEAWELLRKYEGLLGAIDGVDIKRRLKKSLFEMYFDASKLKV